MAHVLAEEAHRLSPRLFFWEAYAPAVKADLSCSALLAAEGVILIDPILLAEEALAEVLALGPPRAVVLTNGHHWRAAEEYRRRFRIPVLAHAEAVEGALRPDETLVDGATVGGDVSVIEVPGAGPGEIALWHPAGSLHLGDAVVNLPPLGFALLPARYCTAPKRLPASLQNLLQREFSLLLLAHGAPLTAAPRARLAQLLA